MSSHRRMRSLRQKPESPATMIRRPGQRARIRATTRLSSSTTWLAGCLSAVLSAAGEEDVAAEAVQREIAVAVVEAAEEASSCRTCTGSSVASRSRTSSAGGSAWASRKLSTKIAGSVVVVADLLVALVAGDHRCRQLQPVRRSPASQGAPPVPLPLALLAGRVGLATRERQPRVVAESRGRSGPRSRTAGPGRAAPPPRRPCARCGLHYGSRGSTPPVSETRLNSWSARGGRGATVR